MSRVTKIPDFEVYSVRAGYKDQEWATIAIKGWQAQGNDKTPREIGEILIHSSYGSWAYQWSHLGAPFKQWLAKTNDKHYIAGKFLGSNAYEFDGEKTVRGLRERVIEWRKDGDFDKEQARAVWDWIEENELEMESSADRFCQCMHDGPRDLECGSQARHFFEEPWELTRTSLNRSFDNFWQQMWPTFQAALREELAAPPPKYKPREGSIPARVLDHLQTQAPGTKVQTAELVELLDLKPNNYLPACLQKARDLGVVGFDDGWFIPTTTPDHVHP